MANASKCEPVLKGDDTAGGIRRTLADLKLTPTGLATQGHHHVHVENLNPAPAVFGLVTPPNIEADNLRAPQEAGKANQQNGAITQPSERARSNVSSVAMTSSGSTASFCFGG